MFDPQEDPLGLGLKARARERRFAETMIHPAGAFASGPLPDEDWDAFFQAVSEANPGKKVNFAGATDASNPITPGADLGTAWAAHSNQLRGYDPYRQLGALTSQKKRKTDY